MACIVHARFGSIESGDVTLMYLTDAASTDSSWSFAKPMTSIIERGCELLHRNALSGVHVAREQHVKYPSSLVPCNRYFPEACKRGGGCCVRAYAEKQIPAGDNQGEEMQRMHVCSCVMPLTSANVLHLS